MSQSARRQAGTPPGFTRRDFSFDGKKRPVLLRGQGPVVIVATVPRGGDRALSAGGGGADRSAAGAGAVAPGLRPAAGWTAAP